MSFNNPNDDNIDELTVERLEADLGRRMDALTAARERLAMKRFIQKEQESQALNQQLIRSTQLLDELKTKRQDQEEEIAGLRAKVKAYDEKQLVIHQEMEQFNAVKKIDEIVLMRKQLESVHKKKETLEESLWERMNYIQAIHDMNEKQEKNDSDLLNKVLDNNSMMQNELVKQGYNTKDRQRIASALLDADGDTHQASIALLEDMIQHRAKKFGDAKQDLQSRKSDLEKTLAMIRGKEDELEAKKRLHRLMITKGHEFSVAVELGHAKKPKIKQRRDPRFGSPASSSVPPSVERKSKSKPSNDYSDISKLRAQLERQEERLAQVRKDIQNDAKKGLRDEVYSQTMKKMMGMKKLTAEGLLAGKGGIAKNEEWGGMQTASKSKWSVVTNSGHNTGSTEKKNAIDMIDAAAEAMRFTNERKRREKMKRKFMKKQKKQEAKKRKEVENRLLAMEQELELDRLKLETKYREKCVEKEVRAQMFQMLAEVVEDIATDAMTELISVQQYSMKTVSDLMLGSVMKTSMYYRKKLKLKILDRDPHRKRSARHPSRKSRSSHMHPDRVEKEGKSGMSAFDDNDAQKSMTAAQYLKRDPEYTSMIDCAFAEMRLRRRFQHNNYTVYDNSELRAIRKQLARQTEKEEEELRRQSKQLFHFFGDKRIDDIRIVTNFLRQREHELMIAGVSNMQTKIGIGGGKNGSNEWNKKRHAKNDDANTSSTAKVVRIYSQHQHLLYHIDHLSSLSPSTSSFRSFPSTSTMSIALPDNDNTAIFNTLRILPLAEQIHAHCISLPKLVLMKRRAEYAQLEHQYWRKVCFNACVYNEEWIEEKMSKDESKSFINEVKEFFKSADTVEGDGDFKTLRNASEKEQNTVLIAKRKPAPVEVNKYSDDYLHTHSNDIMERYGVNELLLAVNKASCGDVGQGLTCLSTSPNGFYCAAGTCNGRILVWDLRLSVLQSSVSSSTFEMSEDAFRHRTMPIRVTIQQMTAEAVPVIHINWSSNSIDLLVTKSNGYVYTYTIRKHIFSGEVQLRCKYGPQGTGKVSGFDKSRLKLTRTLCLIPSDFERPTLDMGNDGNGGVGDDDELGGLFSQFAVFHPTLDIMAKHPSIVIGLRNGLCVKWNMRASSADNPSILAESGATSGICVEPILPPFKEKHVDNRPEPPLQRRHSEDAGDGFGNVFPYYRDHVKREFFQAHHHPVIFLAHLSHRLVTTYSSEDSDNSTSKSSHSQKQHRGKGSTNPFTIPECASSSLSSSSSSSSLTCSSMVSLDSHGNIHIWPYHPVYFCGFNYFRPSAHLHYRLDTRFDSFVRHSESDEVDKVLFNGAHCKSPQDLKRKSRAHLDRINTLMNVRGSTPYHQVQLKDGKIFKTYLENGVRAHILIFMDASPKALLFRHIRTAYIRLRIPGKITQAYITNHSQQSESHLNVFTKGSSPSSLSSSSAAAASGLGSASSGSIPSTFSSTHKYTTLDEEKSSHASHHLVVLVRYPRGYQLDWNTIVKQKLGDSMVSIASEYSEDEAEEREEEEEEREKQKEEKDGYKMGRGSILKRVSVVADVTEQLKEEDEVKREVNIRRVEKRKRRKRKKEERERRRNERNKAGANGGGGGDGGIDPAQTDRGFLALYSVSIHPTLVSSLHTSSFDIGFSMVESDDHINSENEGRDRKWVGGKGKRREKGKKGKKGKKEKKGNEMNASKMETIPTFELSFSASSSLSFSSPESSPNSSSSSPVSKLSQLKKQRKKEHKSQGDRSKLIEVASLIPPIMYPLSPHLSASFTVGPMLDCPLSDYVYLATQCDEGEGDGRDEDFLRSTNLNHTHNHNDHPDDHSSNEEEEGHGHEHDHIATAAKTKARKRKRDKTKRAKKRRLGKRDPLEGDRVKSFRFSGLTSNNYISDKFGLKHMHICITSNHSHILLSCSGASSIIILAINDCNTRKKRGMLNSYVGNAVCSEIDRRREVRAAQTGNAAVNKLKVTSTTDNDNADSASNAFISFGLHGQKERSAALSYSSSIITQDSTGSGSVSNSGMNDAKHAIVRRWVESAPEHRVRRVDRDMHRGLYAASNIPIFDADDGEHGRMARSRYRDSSRPLAGFIRSLLLRLVGEVVDISNREIDQSTVQLGMGSVTAFHMFNDIAKGARDQRSHKSQLFAGVSTWGGSPSRLQGEGKGEASMIQKRLSLASYTAMEHQRIAREEKAYAGVQCIVCGVNVKANDDDSNVTDHHSKDASDGADSHDRANDVIECPHCNAVRYCSIYHQQIDWQHHRGVCEIRSKELQSRQDMEIHITREDASFDLHQCYVCTYDKEEKQKMERGQMEEELKREEKEKKEKKEKGEREETEEVQDGEIGREKGENGGNKHAVYCNACNAVRYCSLAHRFSDWHRHQQLCQFRLMRNGEAEEIDGDCVEDEEDEDVDEDDENEIDHEAQADKRHNVEIGEKEGKYNEDTDNKDEREKDHRNGSFNPDDVIGGERSGLFRTYLIQRAAKFKKSADDDTEEDSRYDADERDHYDGGGVSDGAYKAEEAEVCVDDDGNIILDDDGW